MWKGQKLDVLHVLNMDNTVRALSKLALNGIVNRLHTHVIIMVVVVIVETLLMSSNQIRDDSASA